MKLAPGWGAALPHQSINQSINTSISLKAKASLAWESHCTGDISRAMSQNHRIERNHTELNESTEWNEITELNEVTELNEITECPSPAWTGSPLKPPPHVKHLRDCTCTASQNSPGTFPSLQDRDLTLGWDWWVVPLQLIPASRTHPKVQKILPNPPPAPISSKFWLTEVLFKKTPTLQ